MSYLCIYHKNCTDGFGAALAVKVYCDRLGVECEYMPAQYGDQVPDVTGKTVFIVDFSYDRETLIALNEEADSLTVIDHHKSAMQDLEGLDYCVFDMSRSGAVLTWVTLNPDTPVPLLLNYIQDRDLWLWEMENSKQVSAALLTLEKQLTHWMLYLDDSKVEELILQGGAIVDYQNLQLARTPKGEKIPMGTIAGHKVPCVNATHLVSEMGEQLAQGFPFAALYFDRLDKRVYSLRSAKDGIDVSAVAEQYGGGGHFHAAAFAVDKTDISI
jgi:oligoribonuclease NrnB/cAMP/cGMP phosphodiesterase (DHH superfamily)